MKNLIDKKTNFAMPKLVNLNVDSEKREGESPNNFKSLKKAVF